MFQLLSSFFVPHWSFITNFSNVFLKRKVFCEKKVLQKRNFLFYLRISVLPLITLSKQFFKKILIKKNFFFRNYVSISLFVSIPIDETYKTILIFLAKATFSEKNIFSKFKIFLCIVGLLYLHWEFCRSEKFSMEKVFRKTNFPEILFITFIIPEYPIDNLYQTFQKNSHLESDSLLIKEKTS